MANYVCMYVRAKINKFLVYIWIGHVVRIEEDARTRRVFDGRGYTEAGEEKKSLEGRNRGSPIIDWCDQLGQEAEASVRMCCGMPKPVNRVVIENYVNIMAIMLSSAGLISISFTIGFHTPLSRVSIPSNGKYMWTKRHHH